MSKARAALGLFVAAIVAPATTYAGYAVVCDWSRPGPPFDIATDLTLAAGAIIFGFIGSAVFLGLAMRFARRQNAGYGGFALAGAGAGLAHTAVGAISTLIINALPVGYLLEVFDWVHLALGFALVSLTMTDHSLMIAALAVLAAVAGALSGLIYRVVTVPGRHSPAGYAPNALPN